MNVVGCDIVERLDEVLLARNIKRQAVADAVGFSVGNIAKWKHIGSIPGADVLFAIADYLGISPRWLLTGYLEEHELSPAEGDLLRIYRALNGKERTVMMTNAKGYLDLHESSSGETAVVAKLESVATA